MDWTVEADQYDNGNPCWCVTGPGGAEANFSTWELARDYAAFKNGDLWPIIDQLIGIAGPRAFAD